jgi:DNA-binding transcriptional LysR family regulator
MSYQAAEAVAAGNLVVLLAQHEPPPIPVHLVLPAGRSATAKQRAFAAFAVPRLREALALAAEQMSWSPLG